VGRIGSGVRVSVSLKNPRLVGQLRSGPRPVGRIGSGVPVSASFHTDHVYFALVGAGAKF